MHKLEDLIIWKKAIELTKQVYLICLELPQDERFGLTSQVKRAAISIPSNIAEGSGRNSNKEFSHFLAISLGFAFELQTQLILIKELEILKEEKALELINDTIEIQKMIYSFKNTLNK